MRPSWICAALVIAAGLFAPPLPAEEARSANIDVILLIDKSLSMAPFETAARRYAAGEVVGPVLVPGDRLIIEAFYGKIDRLFAGTIRSEADKAAIVRSLNAIVANGRFTDIGAALDRAKADLDELGMTERPKYVLLLTDERQEAPAGTKYWSPDYKLSHPALQYVKRLDLGGFRAITVGFDVGPRVDKAASQVMRLLAEPPARSAEDFPSLPEGSDPSLGGAMTAAQGGQAKTGQAATGSTAGAAGSATRGAKGQKAGGGGGISLLGGLLAGGAALLCLVFLAILARRAVELRNNRRKGSEKDDLA